jgi:cell division septum initiation protein DivIVA
MTPSELREYEFKGAGRNAYKSDDVDNFFGEVAVAYEKIFRENAELIKRVGLLADRLEQFKKDEEQIKQAVIGAQKAADIIVKEAEMSVEDSKAEAEAILAAAKGEAEIIKSDAEKQAIADSELLLSIARDKAESIINKAKEEAHGIIIEANDSAKDTVGAATRTITSESLHYEMLKKEVSEFRASILAQYKAHIELISKLPELAVEEAEKKVDVEETVTSDEALVDEINSVDPDNDIIEFIETSDDEEEFSLPAFSEDDENGEEVVKTTLPYDFFGEDNSLEFVEEQETEEAEAPDILEFNEAFGSAESDVEFVTEDEEETVEDEAEVEEVADEASEEPVEAADIPISKGFSIDTDSVSDSLDVFSNSEDVKPHNPMFDSFETIDDDDDDEPEEPKKRFGFFKRK